MSETVIIEYVALVTLTCFCNSLSFYTIKNYTRGSHVKLYFLIISLSDNQLTVNSEA